jgi:hypothetical protein
MKVTEPKKGQFPEIDDALLTLFSRAQDWNKLYFVFLVACMAIVFPKSSS